MIVRANHSKSPGKKRTGHDNLGEGFLKSECLWRLPLQYPCGMYSPTYYSTESHDQKSIFAGMPGQSPNYAVIGGAFDGWVSFEKKLTMDASKKHTVRLLNANR